MKPWAHVAGKVRIGEKWQDPTLESPILRALPRDWTLSLDEAPANPLSDLGDKCVGLVIWLAALTLAGQALGMIP